VRVQDVRNALQREVSRRKEIAQQLAALRDGEQPLSSSVGFSPRKAAAKMASLQAEVAARSASIAELQVRVIQICLCTSDFLILLDSVVRRSRFLLCYGKRGLSRR
jgi:hypothetical protein